MAGLLPIDVELRLSGGATNRESNAALGGIMSSFEVMPHSMQGLFHDLDSVVLGAGAGSHYRCIYVYNRHNTDVLTNCTVFINTVCTYIHRTTGVPTAANLAINIGADLAGVGGVAAVTANELTAPAGPVVFTAPVTYGTGVNLGNIPAGSEAALWLKLDWPILANRNASPDHYFGLSIESTVP